MPSATSGTDFAGLSSSRSSSSGTSTSAPWAGHGPATSTTSPTSSRAGTNVSGCIGDKRARSSALQIAEQPRLLDRLRREVGVPLKVLHVTRNPFDNIATEARRHKMSLAEATAWYEQICEAVGRVRPLLDRTELLDVRYERSRPTRGGRWPSICRFLGVEPGPSYLEACAAIVWPSTNRTRDAVAWTPAERRGVERLIEKFEVLGSYTFED